MPMTDENWKRVTTRALPLLLKRSQRTRLATGEAAETALKETQLAARTARNAFEDDPTAENRAAVTAALATIQPAQVALEAANEAMRALGTIEGPLEVFRENWDLLGDPELEAWCDAEELIEMETSLLEQEAAVAAARVEFDALNNAS